jgi:uncharacterized membrane protein YozB (DUF420 family)
MKKINASDILFLIFAVIFLLTLVFKDSSLFQYIGIGIMALWLILFVSKLLVIVKADKE